MYTKMRHEDIIYHLGGEYTITEVEDQSFEVQSCATPCSTALTGGCGAEILELASGTQP